MDVLSLARIGTRLPGEQLRFLTGARYLWAAQTQSVTVKNRLDHFEPEELGFAGNLIPSSLRICCGN
jgi:hypothetical protein